jgi:hypothetical protein
MTYPKFGATSIDLGLQLPLQILTKSKNFKIQNCFWGKFFLKFKLKISQKFFLNFEIFGLLRSSYHIRSSVEPQNFC